MAHRVTITSTYVWIDDQTQNYPTEALARAAVRDFNALAEGRSLPIEAAYSQVPDELIYPTGAELFEQVMLVRPSTTTRLRTAAAA
jgi:hypothetical protein